MDDVKATTLKENKNKSKKKYNFTVYGDELNLNHHINPIMILVLR